MSALQSILNSPVVNALGWTLVHSLWQGVAAAMLLLIAMRLMRSRSAQARYLAASAALVILPIAAAITLTLLFHDAATPRISASLPQMVTASHAVSIEPIPAPTMPSTPSALSFSERFRPLLPWLTLGWMLGVLAIGTCHTAGWLMIRRVRRTGLPVMDNRAQSAFDELIERLNMSRGIRLTQSALVQVPTVVGWLWPIVLLPAVALSGLTPLELRGLLAHELAHIRRRDYLANLVQTAIETLLFYHPAAWWIGRVIRQERENCCDDFAAEVCNRKTYAAALANMESLRQSPPLAVSARGGMLLPRIRRILGLPDAPGRRSIWSALAAVLTVAAIAIAPIILNACSSTAHSAEQSAEPTTAPATVMSSATQPTQSTITVSATGSTADSATAARDDAVKAYQQAVAQQRAEVAAELAKLQAQYSNSNPQVMDAQKQLEAINARLAEVDAANAAAKKEGPAVYYVSGVKRGGVYSIPPQGITLKQAMIAAGGADQIESKSVTVIPPGSSGRWDLKKIYALQDVLNDKAAQMQIQRDDVLMVAASPAVPREEYNISGNVPRPGVYSLAGRQVNLLQALIAAGANPQEMLDKNVMLTRRTEDREREQFFTIRQILKEDGGMTLVAGDRIAVGTPEALSGEPPTRSYRLVIGENQITLEGAPVKLKDLKSELDRILDHSNMILEIAYASEKLPERLTVEAENIAGSISFKSISKIGIRPLGSKAGDESPATQPASSLDEGYYIGGHVKSVGMYSLEGHSIHLTEAIKLAGGLTPDAPRDGNVGILINRLDNSGTITSGILAELAKPKNDPLLKPRDIVEIGVSVPPEPSK